MAYKRNEDKRARERRYYQERKLRSPDKLKEIARGKYLRNREKRIAYARKYRFQHKDKVKESTRLWRIQNRKKVLAMRHRWYKKNAPSILYRAKSLAAEKRRTVILHYGGKCACCGERTYEFLTIEHLNGGGRKHRKEIGPANMASWIIKNNFPNTFTVLCYNCNCAKAFSGICPHKVISQTKMEN